jgi:hypothetical protein
MGSGLLAKRLMIARERSRRRAALQDFSLKAYQKKQSRPGRNALPRRLAIAAQAARR